MKYASNQSSMISFPLGGIGAGSIGLSGSGRLIDWEIANHPNKLSHNGYSHFAVKAETDGRLIDARVLNGDLPPPYTGMPEPAEASIFFGFGFGANRQLLPGMPHFRDTCFDGEFPLASITFQEPAFPGAVKLRAFNPFIPSNDFDSSLPAAAFEVEFENPTDCSIDYTVALSVHNPADCSWHEVSGRCLVLKQRRHPADSDLYGELAVATDAGDGSIQRYWYRGAWMDEINMFWNDFARPGPLPARDYPEPSAENWGDTGTVAGRLALPAKTKGRIRFVLSWYYPNVRNSWQPNAGQYPGWRNWYATKFDSAAAVAGYFLANYDRLLAETTLFHDALFASTLPAPVLEAVSANISILKTPTCLRLENGEFYAFEGCSGLVGSCEGSCTHVWNYAYALPFLFPALERSMRELDYTYNFQPDDGLAFRLQLPLGREPSSFRPCADGTFGGIIKMYREWKISGDTDWLRRWFPSVKRALEYAWNPQSSELWDPARSGVLTGRQHHTLDVELFGPNVWLTGFYLAALDAAAKMAEALGEPETAAEYRRIRAKGRRQVETELFNGEYYVQKIDCGDRELLAAFPDAEEYYWNAEARQIKYQIGNGCGIDQVLAQWHAELLGLDDVFDPERVKSALRSIYRYNFQQSLRNHTNFWRVYGLNDEAGTVICSWPHGDVPAIPIPYATETMHGFEYQAACHMILRGMTAEGVELVKAVRDRYDGVRRNPWNEIECGSNYARSMASYALLNAFAGFRFDLTVGRIGFQPVGRQPGETFRCFWALDGGWGQFELADCRAALTLLYGKLTLRQFEIPLKVERVEHSKRPLPFRSAGGAVLLDVPLELTAGETLYFRE